MLYELRVYHCVPGPASGSVEAVRHDHLERIWQRHGIEQAGFWTVGDRRFEPDSLLFPQMGVARGPRKEVDRLPGRSGMDQRSAPRPRRTARSSPASKTRSCSRPVSHQ